MKHKVTVTEIAPEQHGDWHDAPLKYAVRGPADEVQKFSTKKEALKYATFRRNSDNAVDACHKFMQWA